jgi:Glycosyl hydrolases family 28
VVVYPVPQGYPVARSLSMSVEGHDVPVLQWISGKVKSPEYLYARFSVSGESSVRITWDTPVVSCTIEPGAFSLEPRINGRVVTFTLPGSRYCIVTINGKRLLVMADPPESPVLRPDAPGTVTLSPSVDRTGHSLCTTEIQKLIDTVSQRGGGIVWIPDGTFRSGPLVLHSNVTLHLSPGAVLQADSSPSEGVGDFGKVIHHDHERAHRGFYFLKADDASNIRITGRGMIDLNAGALFSACGWLDSCMRMQGIRNLEVDGITVRENSSWSILVAGCEGVVFRNVKVLNGMGFEQNDAFDIIGSTDVRMEHCFAYARDDSYCLKGGGAGTHGGGVTTRRIKALGPVVVEDCVALTQDGSAFKLGNQSTVGGGGFTCSNLYAIAGRNAVFLALFDGAACYRDLRIDHVFIDAATMAPFRVEIRKGGKVRDLVIDDVFRGKVPVSVSIPPEMRPTTSATH